MRRHTHAGVHTARGLLLLPVHGWGPPSGPWTPQVQRREHSRRSPASPTPRVFIHTKHLTRPAVPSPRACSWGWGSALSVSIHGSGQRLSGQQAALSWPCPRAVLAMLRPGSHTEGGSQTPCCPEATLPMAPCLWAPQTPQLIDALIPTAPPSVTPPLALRPPHDSSHPLAGLGCQSCSSHTKPCRPPCPRSCETTVLRGCPVRLPRGAPGHRAELCTRRPWPY